MDSPSNQLTLDMDMTDTPVTPALRKLSALVGSSPQTPQAAAPATESPFVSTPLQVVEWY